MLPRPSGTGSRPEALFDVTHMRRADQHDCPGYHMCLTRHTHMEFLAMGGWVRKLFIY